MNGYRAETSRCGFHPKEEIVGVCALCLKERLLLLAPKSNSNTSKSKSFKILKKKPSITLEKVFALASFILEFRHRNSGGGGGDGSGKDSTASLDDSFISIKFEDNGKASWDHKTNNKKESRTESVMLPTKPAGGRAMRWKKSIGYLLQMPRKHHVSSWANARRGWSLRMRRTTSTAITTKTG